MEKLGGLNLKMLGNNKTIASMEDRLRQGCGSKMKGYNYEGVRIKNNCCCLMLCDCCQKQLQLIKEIKDYLELRKKEIDNLDICGNAFDNGFNDGRSAMIGELLGQSQKEGDKE
jgi:hypothetical protein